VNLSLGKQKAHEERNRTSEARRSVGQTPLAAQRLVEPSGHTRGSLVALDLASLKSVRECANELLAKGQFFDAIIATRV
jgi:hypothetical protein